MPGQRPDPFTLVLGSLAPRHFPAIRAALEAAGRNPRDRDGFVLQREVATLLHELRPDAGIGEAVEALVALVHSAYLFWADGEQVRAVSEGQLTEMLSDSRTVVRSDSAATRPTVPPSDRPTYYVQLPALRVFGTPIEGPAEPLDGWFVAGSEAGLSLLAVFGLHPARAGLTTVEATGGRPESSQRLDGSAFFAPLLEGGASAGLASLADEAELLELAWRAEELL